jgi:hypothetical protein
MNTKPNEQDWMAYLYGELEDDEKERMDQYLLVNTEARVEFEKFKAVRHMMSAAEDKEVIAPPIFVGDAKQRFLWNTPHFRMIVSIAASLLLVLLAAKATGIRISVKDNEFRLGFGQVTDQIPQTQTLIDKPMLTASEVQQMINQSLGENNLIMQASLKESQQKLDASIKRNLAVNSGFVNQLVKEAATASQEQIRQYVSGIQTENMRVVKDYFQLTADEQKRYMQDLLVDFTQYLQQQRANDLQLVQTQLNSLQQNTNVFKQETEQILTSIISSVGSAPTTETRN